MYPKSTAEFLAHKAEYGRTSVLPTHIFFFGMRPGEEAALEIQEGKILYVKLIAVSEVDAEGMRTLFFELNGYPRDIRVFDKSKTPAQPQRAKADPDDLHQVGAPMPGRIVNVAVKTGDNVQKGDKLFAMEAMKMETSVVSPRPGVIAAVHVKEGDQISSGDLILTFQ
jgi:pyruvate carboxylase